jgi:hypothetical protein
MSQPSNHKQAGRHSAANYNYPALSVSLGASIAALAISNLALTSNVATITVSATAKLAVGQSIYLSGLTTTTAFNTTTVVVASIPTGTTFTAAITHGNISSAAETGTAAVFQQITVANPYVALSDGSTINPVNVNCPVQIGAGSSAEIVPATAISTASATAGTITLAPQNAHFAGENVQSGTYGLQEAINSSSAAGSSAAVVFVDQQWVNMGGTDAILSSATAGATQVEDLRASRASYNSFTTAITANTTLTSLAAGSIGITSNSTGKGTVFYSDGTKWQTIA